MDDAGDSVGRRLSDDLEGGRSPWEERAHAYWQRYSSVTDSSVEQGLEVDRVCALGPCGERMHTLGESAADPQPRSDVLYIDVAREGSFQPNGHTSV